MRTARRSISAGAALIALFLGVRTAHPGDLAGLLENPRLVQLGLAPIAPVLAATVASTYPVASASSSVTYAYDPRLDTMQRREGVAGPIIGERAETIGRGQFNLAVTYSYVHLESIDGDDLDHLVNRATVDGRAIVFPVRDGIELEDGRLTNFLPVRVVADLDVTAHIASASATYGLTPDLDVNLTVPLVRSSLDVSTDATAPDPRLPGFALADPADGIRRRFALDDSAFGIGDLLLRTKYVFLRGAPVDAAAGLGLSLPSGNQDDFHGIGSTQVQPQIILSRVLWDRVEALLNAGIDLHADDVDRSVPRWAVGGTARIAGPLTGALVFLGRHELDAPVEEIPTPFFFQIERSDRYDASVGFRWQFAESGFLAANTIVALNDEGVRAAAIPTFGVEYAF
jgi:hypothetical protein